MPAASCSRPLLLVLALCCAAPLPAAGPPPLAKKPQPYASVLQQAMEQGQLVLAGRSHEPLDRSFGIVIFAAAAAAAVRADVMTAELHPFAPPLLRGAAKP